MNGDDGQRAVPRARRVCAGAAVFPVALWFVATFFLLGDLGKWNDDWFYILREPATGTVRSLYLHLPLHFYRPLYRLVVPALETLLWRHDQVNHLVSAAVHGCNALLLWRLLLVLRLRRQAAALGALLFMVMPAAFEVPFWLCALPSGLSTCLALAGLVLAGRLAQPGSRGLALALPLLTFAAASLNEQPALAILLFPLVPLAIRPAGETRSRVLVTLAPAWLACVAALLVYTLLHSAHAVRPAAIGHEGLVIPLREMPDQIARIAGWARQRFLSLDFAHAALEQAGTALGERPFRSAVVGTILVVSATPWARRLGACGHLRVTEAPARTLAAACFGAALFVIGWAPIVTFNYWLNPRVAYIPALGGSIVLASLASLAGARDRGPRVRTGLALAAGLLFTMFALVMVGVQAGYRDQSRRDRELLEQLRAFVPDPPRGAVFVPAMMAFPECSRHERRFRWYYWNVFCSWWSATAAVKFEYRRDDLASGHADWGRTALRRPTRTDVLIEGTGARVPWDRLVVFEIDSRGALHPITSVRFERPDQEPLEVTVPITSAGAAAGHFSARSVTIPHATP